MGDSEKAEPAGLAPHVAGETGEDPVEAVLRGEERDLALETVLRMHEEGALDDRQLAVLEARFRDEKGYEEIGSKLGLTGPTVSQIEQGALSKVGAVLRHTGYFDSH
ncbi:MAG TPA: sigma factor-like helix-turn-helix DNA-binding protein [Patescibacteria group bacterium]